MRCSVAVVVSSFGTRNNSKQPNTFWRRPSVPYSYLLAHWPPNSIQFNFNSRTWEFPPRLSLIDSTRLDSFGATLPVYTIV